MKLCSRRYLDEARTLLICSLLLPSVSEAQSIEGIINSATNYLQGGIARAVGILSIIVAGYMCIVRQRFPKEYFMMILLGMGIIFGGSSLYSRIIG